MAKNRSIFGDDSSIVPYNYLISSREEFLVIWELDHNKPISMDSSIPVVITEITIIEKAGILNYTTIRRTKDGMWGYVIPPYTGSSAFENFWDEKEKGEITALELFAILNNIDEENKKSLMTGAFK
jgi:hypothetical protein